ncbi:MAG: LysE family transporter [Desulfobulbaceae bacterium]|nr:LysE family transporter [Desulfobulbaceae bacterium]
MLQYLFMGIVLGLSAGFAPGPLLTLVISETMQHDIKSGVRVALAPVVTDAPIIVLTLLVLAKLAHFHSILAFLSCVGSFFVFYLGWETLRKGRPDVREPRLEATSLRKGVLVNFLSPHPYLFWLTVGGPAVTQASKSDLLAPVAFIGSFYILLVGSKILLAILVGRCRSFMSGRIYVFIMRILGLLLWGLAAKLLLDGLRLSGTLVR